MLLILIKTKEATATNQIDAKMEESPEKEMRCVFDDFAYFFVKTYVVVLIRIASPRRF